MKHLTIKPDLKDFQQHPLRSVVNSRSRFSKRQTTMLLITIDGKLGLALPQAANFVDAVKFALHEVDIDCDQQ